MKNVKSVLTYCNMLRKFGYHNVIQAFKLTCMKESDYNDDFYEILYEGLSEKDSTLQMRMGSQKYSGTITFELYDTVLQCPVACFSLGSITQHTTMYQNWLTVNYKSDRFFVYDKKSENHHEEIFPSIGEDEHFQLMMMRETPEYEDIQNAFEYVEKMYPLLKYYRLCSLAQYESLDVDFSKHVPKEEVLKEIDIQFPGMLQYYNEAEDRVTEQFDTEDLSRFDRYMR